MQLYFPPSVPARPSFALSAAAMMYLVATLLYCAVVFLIALVYLVLVMGYVMLGPGSAHLEADPMFVFLSVSPMLVVIAGFIGVNAAHRRTSVRLALACGAFASIVSSLVAAVFSMMTLDEPAPPWVAVLYLWSATLLYMLGLMLVSTRQDEFPAPSSEPSAPLPRPLG